MSEDITKENTATEEQPVETGTQSSDQLQAMNEKLFAEVKSLRAEAKGHRLDAQEAKKEVDTLQTAKLSTEDKVAKLSSEFGAYKTQVATERLTTEFTQRAVEAGLPLKIAKIAIPSDLSEDTMKDSIKGAVKEFGEFVKTEEETPPKRGGYAAQPSRQNTDKKKNPQSMTGMDVVNDLLDKSQGMTTDYRKSQ